MAPITLAQFVERLCLSQLLDKEPLDEILALQGKCVEARDLAQELLGRAWLTPYQVDELFEDRGDGLVLGQYILLERLGEGGMGQVFKARQRNLHRACALKIIRRDCLNNPNIIQRFQREIRAAGQLSHPNIVRAYDAAEINGNHFIAMELIDGIDLARLVRESGPLPVAQACDYIRQAALGLQHAHECGLVHRDIKPANLLVTRAVENRHGSNGQSRSLPGETWGTVKILDMGLARLTDPETGQDATHLTQMGTIMGTPDYISPEQAANSRTCDIRADIYSLGCTFYYLLSGQAPFPDGTLLEKLIRHQQDEPIPVEDARRARLGGMANTEATSAGGSSVAKTNPFRVPAEVEAILKKMLAKNPQDRFQSPGELADTLADVSPLKLSGQPTDHAHAVSCVNLDKTLMATDSGAVHLDATAAGPTSLAAKAKSPSGLAAPKLLPLPRKRFALVIAGGALLIGIVLAQVAAKSQREGDPQAAAAGAAGGSPGDTRQPTPDARPADPAEILWEKLAGKVHRQSTDVYELCQDLVRYRAQFWNTPQAGEVTSLLAMLPSPFDSLHRAQIDKKQVFDWQPKEVVGVLGSWTMVSDPKNPDPKYQHALAVSPDGRYVVSCGPKGLIRTWDMATQLEHKVHGHTKQIFRVAFAPDGRTFATASFDGATKLWDAKSRDLLYTLEKPDREAAAGRSKIMASVAYSPDGTVLASAGGEGIIRFWDTTTGVEKKSWDGKLPRIMALTFTPDEKHLFWAGDNGLVRWARLATNMSGTIEGQNHQLRTRPGVIKALAFSPDGQTLVMGDGKEGGLRLGSWNGTTLKPGPPVNEKLGYVHAVAFAPDGKTFVSVSEDKTVKLWDTKAGKVKQSWELRWPIFNVAYTPDGRHFLTANGNSTVYIFRPGPAGSPAVAVR